MAMKTGEQYRASLNDGRAIYADGERVTDLENHPQFGAVIDDIAKGYDRYFVPGEDACGPYYAIPTSVDTMKHLIAELLEWNMATVTTSQGLLALLTAGTRLKAKLPEYAARIEAYFEWCKKHDIRAVQAITDAKGDRKLSPSKQDDPDLYTRIVELRADGIVIRGAKLHISSAAVSHEMVVMPTKMMKPGEEDWAVACAVPVNAPGVRIVNTNYAPRDRHEDFPVSTPLSAPEGFIIFDDVFVPNERVFLAGETEFSASFAHSLGLWERLGGTAHLAETGDTLVGLADLIAEANGTQGIPHIKEKIAEMVIYATLVRAGLEAAIANAEPTPEGWFFPSELYTNAAKHYAAAEFSHMVRHLHDIGGGAIVTAPSMADLRNPDVGDDIRKYMRTKEGISGEYRMRLFHTIRDMTADALGGWNLVTMLQSGGGLYAQRVVARKHYDMKNARALALAKAGLDEPVIPGAGRPKDAE